MTKALSQAEPPAVAAGDDDGEARLFAIPARWRPIAHGLWWLWFALIILVQGFGLWLATEELAPAELLMLNGTGLIAAAILLTAATLLVRRNAGNPVAFLLSLSFLSAATYVGTSSYVFGAFELGFLGTLLPALWLGLLVAALPVFPDGRFVPRWSRWLTLLALPFTILISADTIFEDESVILATTLLGFSIGIAAVAASVVRFLRTPHGLARQQLKWASLGFGLGMLLLILSVVVAYAAEAELFPEDSLLWVQIGYYALHDFGFALTALGFLVAQLRLRLWDADRAIGRSAAYFLLTLILACVWAVSSALVNDLVSSQLGSANKGANAAVATLIAILVFGPAREKVNKWMEGRFQRGVVRLRKLPDKLRVWQHLDDPSAFGSRVAGAVEDSLNAAGVAVLLFEHDRFRLLAARGAVPADLDAWAAAQGGFGALDEEARGDAAFPLRLILTDDEVLIGALLVARRSDGSFYAKPERKALFDLEPPLSAALHRVQRRTLTNQAVDQALTGLDARLGRVEESVQAS